MERNSRPIYQPPKARDLSISSVKGDMNPRGICLSGGTPYMRCRIGSDFSGGSCNRGIAPQLPKCTAGSTAFVRCWTGGSPSS